MIMPASPYRAVLFDKDGTLFAFTETWANFCDRVFDVLAGNDELRKNALAAACGYDRTRRHFQPGSLIVNGTADEVCAAWLDHLPDMTLAQVEAASRDILNDLPLVPTCDLPVVLGKLRQMGLFLGVATNDYEAGALGHLQQADALALFDFVCGSDSGYGSKPGPGMVHGFCQTIGIAPHELILVGDSRHDMECGKAAGAGLLIAVLTGPADAEHLAPLADTVLPSIGELPAHLVSYPEGQHQRQQQDGQEG